MNHVFKKVLEKWADVEAKYGFDQGSLSPPSTSLASDALDGTVADSFGILEVMPDHIVKKEK